MRNYFLSATTDALAQNVGSDRVTATTDTNTVALVAAPAPTGSLDELAAYLTDGYWQDNGLPRHSFDTSLSNKITVDLNALPPEAQTLARAAMQTWGSVADIRFVEVQSGPQITFTDNQPGAYSAFSYIGEYTQSATVNISADWLATHGSELDNYSFLAYMHELGHALGLGHQGQYNGAANFGTDAVYGNDSYQMSVMSYFSQIQNNNVNASYALPLTGMSADIVAMQALYGKPGNGSATGGKTIYGFGQTVGGYLGLYFDILTTGQDPDDMLGNGPVAMTIYDRSGRDTVDFRTDSSDQQVDLSDQGVWNVFGLTGNVVLARGTVIESYIAGAGNDWVQGNGARNKIRGGRNEDTLNGLEGHDTLNGGGGRDLLQGGGGNDLIYGGTGSDTMRGDGGHDTLNGGAGQDQIIGGSGRDSIFGGAGSDTLRGDGGRDTLIGGLGDDKLTGGNGADDFVFDPDFGQDEITDFRNNMDELHLDDALWSGSLSAQEVINTFASSANGNTILDFGNGNIIVLAGITDAQVLVDDIVIF